MARGLATLVLVAAALAAPAHGTIGSVISSFILHEPPADKGIYLEGGNVYLSLNVNNYNYLCRFTTRGSIIATFRLTGSDPYPLGGGSRTHLGMGYVGFCDSNNNAFKIFRLTGGAAVTSFATINTPRNNFWDGQYYYVNRRTDRGTFRRYTPGGSPAGTWTCTGWPATMRYCGGAVYTQRGNYGPGPYFVASANEALRPSCITTFPAGSLVSTWAAPYPGNVASVFYADSSNPGTYGAAIWAIMENPRYVVEFDIDARNAASVLPASLGKVKAIYR
jgi:hypothetical protein